MNATHDDARGIIKNSSSTRIRIAIAIAIAVAVQVESNHWAVKPRRI